MTLIRDKCAVGWTTLGINLVNLNLTLIKPKPQLLKKVNKNRCHEKCNHYKPDYGKSQYENHSHSKTRLPDYHDSAANVTNLAFYSNCVTANGRIATSKQEHPAIL